MTYTDSSSGGASRVMTHTDSLGPKKKSTAPTPQMVETKMMRE